MSERNRKQSESNEKMSERGKIEEERKCEREIERDRERKRERKVKKKIGEINETKTNSMKMNKMSCRKAT